MHTADKSESGSILLAVDGSASAKSAAYAATQIAATLQWGIHAVYVVDITQVFDVYGNTRQELNELGKNIPNEMQSTLFEEQGTLALAEIEQMCEVMNVPLTREMIFGGVPEIILEAAKKHDLLALGRRGNRRKEDPHHLGENFQKIASHSQLSLLIGSSEITLREITRALLAYDGSELSRQALNWTERLQALFMEVVALSIEKEGQTEPAWLKKRQNEIADSSLPRCKFIGERGEPRYAIVSTALSRQMDLIVMGSYRHSQFLEWTTHSVLNAVLKKVNALILATK
jgi:nucleotide-binding universal stress UspA family protein